MGKGGVVEGCGEGKKERVKMKCKGGKVLSELGCCVGMSLGLVGLRKNGSKGDLIRGKDRRERVLLQVDVMLTASGLLLTT